jgi:chromosome segregation ATPase
MCSVIFKACYIMVFVELATSSSEPLNTIMRSQVAGEIARFEARAQGLEPATREFERQLAVLVTEIDSAREAKDEHRMGQLSRKIQGVRHNQAQLLREIQTLRDLIDARRARYGISEAESAVAQQGVPG